MLSASITLLAREPGATISPFLHGHFVEHLGEGVYPGLWVGPDSPIPNERGLRADALEALRELAPPVLRWPGGCFAEAYGWRDGVGPRESRPTRVLSRGGRDERESNALGTHEFIDLCRQVGAEPWLVGNVGSGSPRELAHWVEYCNFPGGTTLSDARAKNGDSDAFEVKFWGIGNPGWECGGKFTAADYAREYRRFESRFPRFENQEPLLIGCGPAGGTGESARWTREFLAELADARPPATGRLERALFYQQQRRAVWQRDRFHARPVLRFAAREPSNRRVHQRATRGFGRLAHRPRRATHRGRMGHSARARIG